jgi:hypothetical protein
MSDAILIFNGHRHAADKVLGKASIPVEVAYKDINDDLKLVGLDNVGDVSPYYSGTTVFIKFEGKFVPLLGRSRVLTNTTDPERLIKGLLITSVALKATRIDTYSPAAPAGPVTLKTPTEGIRLGEPEARPPRRYETQQHSYGDQRRQESATGSSLRSRSPYRSPYKRSGV